MTNAFLANLIPDSNRIEVAFANRAAATSLLEGLYAESSGFVGVFIDEDGQPSWARRAARYLADEFMHDTPGRIKLFGDVLSTIGDDGAGQCLPNWRYALDAWIAGGRQGVEPYTAQQDYGSCVDASCGEHETVLTGYRAAKMPEVNEEWRLSSAWYKYADRDYCSDGWNGSGIATVAKRVGMAFRTKYEIGSNSVDFTDDDANERTVARTWCRSGIPAWLKEHTSKNHAYEDGAITQFDGGVKELRAMFAAGGVIHTSGTRTSGGSKPFTLGRVGPHMQSGIGCDDSDEFRKFCKDVIGVSPRANDFPVVMNQTWGSGWRGECADKYWPSWWGPKPQGAWVWWASDVINLLSCDYAWLPRVKGFQRTTPLPPTPDPTKRAPVLVGHLRAEPLPHGIAVRGEISLTQADRTWYYIAVPTGDGLYALEEKPQL